jgi:hypothetical protein
MSHSTRRIWAALAAVLVGYAPAPACDICNGAGLSRQTLRQDAAQAKLVLFGTLVNPRLNPGGSDGVTDLRIEAVIRDDPFLGDRKVLEIPRFMPAGPKGPPLYVIFFDVYKGKLDPYRGLEVKSSAIVAYLKGALALDPKDRTQALPYFFEYLDHRDPEIAADAFLEFAKSTNSEVGQVAPRLSADKVRRLVQDPQTPPERLGLYAFLLGACGGDADAAVLHGMVLNPTDRTRGSLGGLLSGYLELRPQDGWVLTMKLLRDESRPFTERMAVLGTLRFYHGWKPERSRRDVLRGLEVLLAQGDIADLAVEDLRRWQYWDLTLQVLALDAKRSHDAPIMRRAILRYALCCPRAEAVRFVTERRKQDPELVKDVEESLQFDKTK